MKTPSFATLRHGIFVCILCLCLEYSILREGQFTEKYFHVTAACASLENVLPSS